MKSVIILTSCLVCIIVLIVTYYVMEKKQATSKTNKLPISNSVSIQPTIPPTMNINAGKTGVWYRNPGSLNSNRYTNGYDLGQSIKYCYENKADMAGFDLVKAAASKGMKYCAPGWHRKDNDYDASMFGNGLPGCSTTGERMGYDINANAKIGTYCFGIIPTTPEVVVSMTF